MTDGTKAFRQEIYQAQLESRLAYCSGLLHCRFRAREARLSHRPAATSPRVRNREEAPPPPSPRENLFMPGYWCIDLLTEFVTVGIIRQNGVNWPGVCWGLSDACLSALPEPHTSICSQAFDCGVLFSPELVTLFYFTFGTSTLLFGPKPSRTDFGSNFEMEQIDLSGTKWSAWCPYIKFCCSLMTQTHYAYSTPTFLFRVFLFVFPSSFVTFGKKIQLTTMTSGLHTSPLFFISYPLKAFSLTSLSLLKLLHWTLDCWTNQWYFFDISIIAGRGLGARARNMHVPSTSRSNKNTNLVVLA